MSEKYLSRFERNMAQLYILSANSCRAVQLKVGMPMITERQVEA